MFIALHGLVHELTWDFYVISRSPSEFDLSSGEKELLIPIFLNKVSTKVIPPGVFNKLYYKAYCQYWPEITRSQGYFNQFILRCWVLRCWTIFSRRKLSACVFYWACIEFNRVHKTEPPSAQYKEIMMWLDEQPDSSALLLRISSPSAKFFAFYFPYDGAFEISSALKVWHSTFLMMKSSKLSLIWLNILFPTRFGTNSFSFYWYISLFLFWLYKDI